MACLVKLTIENCKIIAKEFTNTVRICTFDSIVKVSPGMITLNNVNGNTSYPRSKVSQQVDLVEFSQLWHDACINAQGITGAATMEMCRIADGKIVTILIRTDSNGNETYSNAVTGDSISALELRTLYVLDKTAGCTCTIVFYESDKGETIDNALLLLKAANATFPDGSIGGGTGISQVQGALIPINSVLKTGDKATEASLTSVIINGNSIGFTPGDSIDLGDSNSFTHIPPFTVNAETLSSTKWAYTVYKC